MQYFSYFGRLLNESSKGQLGPLFSSSILCLILFPGCQCTGKTEMNPTGQLEGECRSFRKDEMSWRLWCFAEEEGGCGDVKDGRSFEACQNGKFCSL